MKNLAGQPRTPSRSGVADGAFDNDVEALLSLRQFIDFLPASNVDEASRRQAVDPVTRTRYL